MAAMSVESFLHNGMLRWIENSMGVHLIISLEIICDLISHVKMSDVN
jgi:hypothetical protein